MLFEVVNLFCVRLVVVGHTKMTPTLFPSRTTGLDCRRSVRTRLLARRRHRGRATPILSSSTCGTSTSTVSGRHQQRRRTQRARLRFARHVHSDHIESGPAQRRRHRRHPASAEQYGKGPNGIILHAICSVCLCDSSVVGLFRNVCGIVPLAKSTHTVSLLHSTGSPLRCARHLRSAILLRCHHHRAEPNFRRHHRHVRRFA